MTTQRSLAASGISLQRAPGTLPGGFPGQLPRGPQTLADRFGAEFGLDGSPDAHGNARACPATTFPKLMPRLSNLYRLRRLDDLFRKVPEGVLGKPVNPPPPVTAGDARLPPEIQATPVHEYAHAYRSVNNIGMRADFNLWSPFVEQAEEFSLSQLWVARGNTNDNSLQTAETGWQRCRLIYGDDVSHLFIYHTRANYTANSGCYNLSCTAFVQTDSSVVIGGGWTTFSSQGGTQYDISLGYYRDPSPPNNWWLMYGSTFVGYFPNSLYNSAGIANYCDHIDYGGEIVNDATGGLHTTTVMGSGRFPSEAFGHAAYIKRIQYYDMSAALQNATGLTPSATYPSYYDIALVSSSDTNWYQYFYFGGPGTGRVAVQLLSRTRQCLLRRLRRQRELRRQHLLRMLLVRHEQLGVAHGHLRQRERERFRLVRGRRQRLQLVSHRHHHRRRAGIHRHPAWDHVGLYGRRQHPLPQQQPLQGPGGVPGLRRQHRDGLGPEADRPGRVLLLLRRLQPRGPRQVRQLLQRQLRELDDLCLRPHRRRGDLQGDRHEDEPLQGIQERSREQVLHDRGRALQLSVIR